MNWCWCRLWYWTLARPWCYRQRHCKITIEAWQMTLLQCQLVCITSSKRCLLHDELCFCKVCCRHETRHFLLDSTTMVKTWQTEEIDRHGNNRRMDRPGKQTSLWNEQRWNLWRLQLLSPPPPYVFCCCCCCCCCAPFWNEMLSVAQFDWRWIPHSLIDRCSRRRRWRLQGHSLSRNPDFRFLATHPATAIALNTCERLVRCL